MNITFRDRIDAGQQLAEAVRRAVADPDDAVVLALPRGGVTVAAEVAAALRAELDVLVVRKVGHPLHQELALGAVARGGIRVLNPEVAATVAPHVIRELVSRELREVERREHAYRGERPFPKVHGRTVILVDDGLATGATMLAAVRAVRALHARRVIVAVPVGDPDVCARIAAEADSLICLSQPTPMLAVGYWYEGFEQVTDEQVCAALEHAHSMPVSPT